MHVKIDECYHCDCRVLLNEMIAQGIKADWCITDPPYGIGYDKTAHRTSGEKYGHSATVKRTYSAKKWDTLVSPKIFELIRMCSQEQLIFGGNYYSHVLPATRSWVVWNKRMPNSLDRNDLGDCELAWCSKGVARVFNYMYNGMLQDDMKNKDYRFHPTQKPTQLWIQILNFYTQENDLILDPFAGSQSLRIACHRTNRRYIGCEIDDEYYKKGCEWFNDFARQISFF